MVEQHQTPKIWNTRSSILFSFDGLYRKDNKNVVDQVKKTNKSQSQNEWIQITSASATYKVVFSCQSLVYC